MKKEVIAHKNPKSPISEVFRTLRTNIQFMNSNKKLKTLLVTSTVPGEGKSWISSNLAVAFAQAGKRVVLIDADMRKGRVYNIFGVLPRPGLSNYLSGVNENNQEETNIVKFIRETEVPNLYVMPAGNIPPNPSEILITPQMANLLEDLKRECDLVIIDATPCKLVTDAVILSRIVDSTIIVTAHNQTKKDDLEKVVKDIKNVGGNIVGVVYNKIPVSAKKYNETYYYSSRSQSTQINPKRELEMEKAMKQEMNRLSRNIEKAEMQSKKMEQEIQKVEEKIVEEQVREDIKKEEISQRENERIAEENNKQTVAEEVGKFEEMELPRGLRKDFNKGNNNRIEQHQNERKAMPTVAEEYNKSISQEKKQEPKQASEKEEKPKTQQEKTEDVLREFNEYLKKEKKRKFRR